MIDSLERQLALYKRLLEVTQQERKALSTRDVEAVRACVNEKTGLLADLRAAAARGAQSMKSLSACFPVKQRAVSDLARLLSGESEQRLQAICGEIGAVKAALVRENRKNGLFAANSLRYVTEMIGLLSGSGADRTMYDRNGRSCRRMKTDRCDRRA